ncbi:MAG TPA: tail fiber domain-containing protein [Vicinamibacterales bacterium]
MHLNRILAAVTALGIWALAPDAMAQTPTITSVSISGTGVSVSGTNLTGTSAITIADQTVTAITVNSDGTLVMGDLLVPLAAGSHRMTLTVTSVQTPTCPTGQPGPTWVCVAGGGWVPPDHPLAVSGTSTTQTLTFVVAEGVDGTVGPQGPQGPTGPSGPAGPSGGAILPDGLAVAPSLAFMNSPTTGFYRSAPDQFAIATAGSGRLIVRADGDVEFPGRWRRGGAVFLHAPGTSIGLGSSTLGSLTTGQLNVAIGADALGSLTTGSSNIALGAALHKNTTGNNNIGINTNALVANTTGHNNVALGVNALLENTNGSNNVALGVNALLSNTTGSNNVAIGSNAGSNLLNGSSNLYLANPGIASESQTIRIGTGHARTFIAGIRGVTTGVADAVPVLIDSNGQLGMVSSSRRYKDDIRDMADASSRIHQLRPVTFRYVKPYTNGARPIQFGLIAEEVAEVFPELTVINEDGQPETVKYQDLTPMLLNEVQKEHVRGMDHADRIGALEAQVQEQRELIAQLLERLAALEAGSSR